MEAENLAKEIESVQQKVNEEAESLAKLTESVKIAQSTIAIMSKRHDDANAIFGVGQWVLQQDNAPLHTANHMINTLTKSQLRLLDKWPPYSPDIAPIELVCSVIGWINKLQNN